MKNQQINTRHASIEVLEHGANTAGLLVILLASLGRGAHDYDDVGARVAAEGFRVVCPNPRGFGASTGPMHHVTLHDYARDMKDIIDHYGGGPAVIGGHAFGNFVARTTAADFPHAVKAVMLIAATHLWPLPPEIRQSIHDSHLTANRERQLEALKHAFFAPGNDASVWLDGWNETVMHAERDATESTPKPEWWTAGSAPVFDLIPENDIMTPPDFRHVYRDEMGAHRVTVSLIPRAGHALLPEQPQATAEAIVQFLKSMG